MLLLAGATYGIKKYYDSQEEKKQAEGRATALKVDNQTPVSKIIPGAGTSSQTSTPGIVVTPKPLSIKTMTTTTKPIAARYL